MRRLLLSLLVLSLLPSCVPQRDYVYFYKKDKAKQYDSIHQNVQVIPIPNHVIAIGDVVDILITSDVSLDVNMMQNKETPSGSGKNNYVVPATGYLLVPLVGKLKVVGMLDQELQDTLIGRLKKFYVDPFVQVTVVSFNISVIGLVRVPGMKQVPGDHISIIEALALAGDLEEGGKRTEIKVVREVQGKIEMFNLDISSTTIFSSGAYYLQSNDLVVVTPYKDRRVLSKLTAVTVLSTVLNSTLIILNIIQRL